MPKAAQHRDKLLQTAVRLLRQQGYANTGIAELLEKSGAPKGSLYHYFPGGKEEIGMAALEAAGHQVSQTLQHLLERTNTGSEFLRAYIAEIRHWLSASGFKDGCPIATTLLETLPHSDNMQTCLERVIDDWLALISDAYLRDGVSAAVARRHAVFVFSAIEGALIVSRVKRNTDALDAVAIKLAEVKS